MFISGAIQDKPRPWRQRVPVRSTSFCSDIHINVGTGEIAICRTSHSLFQHSWRMRHSVPLFFFFLFFLFSFLFFFDSFAGACGISKKHAGGKEADTIGKNERSNAPSRDRANRTHDASVLSIQAILRPPLRGRFLSKPLLIREIARPKYDMDYLVLRERQRRLHIADWLAADHAFSCWFLFCDARCFSSSPPFLPRRLTPTYESVGRRPAIFHQCHDLVGSSSYNHCPLAFSQYLPEPKQRALLHGRARVGASVLLAARC